MVWDQINLRSEKKLSDDPPFYIVLLVRSDNRWTSDLLKLPEWRNKAVYTILGFVFNKFVKDIKQVWYEQLDWERFRKCAEQLSFPVRSLLGVDNWWGDCSWEMKSIVWKIKLGGKYLEFGFWGGKIWF